MKTVFTSGLPSPSVSRNSRMRLPGLVREWAIFSTQFITISLGRLTGAGGPPDSTTRMSPLGRT
jgi:hypothetical protein